MKANRVKRFKKAARWLGIVTELANGRRVRDDEILEGGRYMMECLAGILEEIKEPEPEQPQLIAPKAEVPMEPEQLMSVEPGPDLKPEPEPEEESKIKIETIEEVIETAADVSEIVKETIRKVRGRKKAKAHANSDS